VAEETPDTETGGGGGNRMIIVLIVVMFISIGVLGFFLFQTKQELKTFMEASPGSMSAPSKITKDDAQLTAEEKEEKGMGPLVDLGGQIVVNLTGLDGRSRLLRTSLRNEVDSQETRRMVESKIVVVRYKLTRLLSSRRPEEVIGHTQMEQVRANMKSTVDAIFKSQGKIVDVWPSDWILE